MSIYTSDQSERMNELHQCVICLTDTEDNITLKCSHVFCRDCIQHAFYVKRIDNCPLCRRHFTLDNLNVADKPKIVKAIKYEIQKQQPTSCELRVEGSPMESMIAYIVYYQHHEVDLDVSFLMDPSYILGATESFSNDIGIDPEFNSQLLLYSVQLVNSIFA